MIKISNILVPVDFSDHSKDAVKAALRLKDDFGAALTLLHVFDVTELLGMGWTVYGEALEGEAVQRMEEDSNRALDEFVKELEINQDDIDLIVARGKPFIEIIQIAKREKSDLIVMGTHGRKGIELVLMGSNAEKVVRKAPCSVMTLRHEKGKSPQPFPAKKILVPTDFSLTSERAMTMAVEVAAKYNSKIVLLHVFSDFKVEDALQWTSYINTPKTEIEMREEIIKRSYDELESFMAKFPVGDVKIEPRVVEDHPHKGILSVAEDDDIDLVVMGTHGRTGVSHLLMGSTAEKVVRTNSCPVLTVKPRNYVFEMP